MKSIVKKVVDDVPWGIANKGRGKKFHDLAVTFVGEFPIGTVLSADQFDQWAQKNDQYITPPSDAPKDSDAWLAHLQRRHNLRYNIIKAATHPRLLEKGCTPFTIEAISNGQYEVRAPHDALHKQQVPQKIESLLKTSRRKLVYLMQSTDWNLLPPFERKFAEALYDDIDLFEQQVDVHVEHLTKRYAKLTSSLSSEVKAGHIHPTTGAVASLTFETDETDDDQT